MPLARRKATQRIKKAIFTDLKVFRQKDWIKELSIIIRKLEVATQEPQIPRLQTTIVKIADYNTECTKAEANKVNDNKFASIVE